MTRWKATTSAVIVVYFYWPKSVGSPNGGNVSGSVGQRRIFRAPEPRASLVAPKSSLSGLPINSPESVDSGLEPRVIEPRGSPERVWG